MRSPGSRVKFLVSIAIVLSLVSGGVWYWRARSQPVTTAPTVLADDAPERSLEEIEAAGSASKAFQDGLAHEADAKWKNVHWSPSLDAALKLAREVNKPVLVLLSVREAGTQDPARC